MKPLELRRHKEIIAFKAEDESITAFHAYNMEVAEISPESYAQMTPISITTGEIPDVKFPVNPEKLEAFSALNEWNAEDNPNTKNGKLEFGIRSITLNVNQICNLKCTYCAAGGDGTYGEPMNKLSVEKTLPQLKFFLMQLKPGQKFAISFVGGEPLLHPEAILAIHNYVFEEAKKLQIIPSLQIVTNGTLLTGKTLEIVRAMKVKITVSIDGSKEYNDKARPTKNGQSSTDLTVSGIKEILNDRGNIISIGLSAVCSKESPSMLETYKFFETLKPDWCDFTMAYAENSPELQERFITELQEIARLAFEAGGEQKLRQVQYFDHKFAVLDSQLRIENYCGAGKSYAMIDAKNRMYSCPWDVGKPSETIGQNEQYDTTRLANYSKSLIELNNCQTCWARHLCGGGCMHINRELTGHKHKKDQMFCERMRSLLLTAILYYKISRSAA